MKYYPRYRPGKPCPHNEAVVCPDKTQCFRCGWDPKVAEKRIADLINGKKKKTEGFR